MQLLLSPITRYSVSSWYNIIFSCKFCIFLPFIGSALLISGDIEKNPGPGNLSGHNISIYHWNLNRVTANNFVKISLLDAYNAVHDFDLFCISETFLDSDY